MTRFLVAASLTILSGIQANAEAAEVGVRVRDAYDGIEQEWYATGSDEVDGLNRPGSIDAIKVDEGGFWEAHFFEAFEDAPLAGAVLTSVSVVISYRADFDGSEVVELSVRTSDFELIYAEAHASDEWRTVTIDVTEALLARPDPVAAVNRMVVRFVNTSTEDEAEWRYARMTVVYEANAPETPSVTAPEDRETGVSVTPRLEASEYAHPAGLAHHSSDWRIYTDSGLDSLAAECARDTRDLTSVLVGPDAFSFVGDLAGAGALRNGTTYWVTVTFRDSAGGESVSKAIRFTTSAAPPDSPSITSPSSGATVSRNPTAATSSYSHPSGSRHASTDWEIFADAELRVRAASSLRDRANLESIDVSPSSVTFEGPLSGEAALSGSTDYWIRAAHRDADGAVSESVAVRFRTVANASPDNPFIVSPDDGQSGVSRVPSFVAGRFSDPDGDRHASSSWEVYRNAGLSARVAAAVDMQDPLLSVDLGDEGVEFEGALLGKRSLASETDYWAVVTFRDSAGASSRSVAVHFTTASNAPPRQPVVASPASATNVPRDATVTLGEFDDPDADEHLATEWRIYEDVALTRLVASCVGDSARLNSVDIGREHMEFGGTHAKDRCLKPNSEYWLSVAHVDSHGGRAETVFRFTTALGAPPDRAEITSPQDNETGVSQNPLIRAAGYHDEDGDAHAHTDWEIYAGSGLRQLSATSYEDRRHMLSIRVNPSTMEFQRDLEGANTLELDKWYWARVRFVDSTGEAGAWSELVQFRTSDTLQPPDDSWPIFGEGCVARGAGQAAGSWLPWAAALMLIFGRLVKR